MTLIGHCIIANISWCKHMLNKKYSFSHHTRWDPERFCSSILFTSVPVSIMIIHYDVSKDRAALDVEHFVALIVSRRSSGCPTLTLSPISGFGRGTERVDWGSVRYTSLVSLWSAGHKTALTLLLNKIVKKRYLLHELTTRVNSKSDIHTCQQTN